MIKFTFDPEKLIARGEPTEKLSASDFEELAKKVDPIINKSNHINGLMLVVKSFPGWENFDALAAHLNFVKNHHEKINKLALVTSDTLLKLLAETASKQHFVHPEIQIFDDEEEAKKWLSS